jgi:hypothetical protein
MKGDNLMMHKGRRACLACWRHHAANPPIHSILPVLDLIKDDLRRGISLGQICHGKPTGGGKMDRRLIRVRPNVFYRYRQLNPDFNQFVLEAIADSNSVGQTIRFSQQRARIRTASVSAEPGRKRSRLKDRNFDRLAYSVTVSSPGFARWPQNSSNSSGLVLSVFAMRRGDDGGDARRVILVGQRCRRTRRTFATPRP